MDKIFEKNSLKCATQYMITQLSEELHDNAVAHGFYDEHDNLIGFLSGLDAPEKCVPVQRDFVLAQLAKITSEVSEAVEVIQHGKLDSEDFAEELADVIIRTLDLCGFLRIDAGKAVIDKAEKNILRPYRHGKVC